MTEQFLVAPGTIRSFRRFPVKLGGVVLDLNGGPYDLVRVVTENVHECLRLGKEKLPFPALNDGILVKVKEKQRLCRRAWEWRIRKGGDYDRKKNGIGC
jgi:hypothetical protein